MTVGTQQITILSALAQMQRTLMSSVRFMYHEV